MPDIVVTAHPGSIDTGNTSTQPAVGTQQILIAQAQQYWNGPNKVIIDKQADVVGDDITVIGTRMKQASFGIFANAFAGSTGHIINVPILGQISNAEIVGIMRHLKFTASNLNFGEGRAGQNLVGQGNSEVPVIINVKALRGYAALTGGLDYLVFHEVAHALSAMQTYNAQMWDAYRNGPGKGLSAAEQAAQYPESDQFKANEARANTIAKFLSGGGANWNFTPMYGYQ